MTTIAQAAQLFPLVLGGNVFGWTADETESFAVLDAFADAGGVMIDTADMYSVWKPGNVGGESETIIGRWLARSGRRDQMHIATKVAKHPELPGLAPDNMRRALDGSMRRLDIDHVDLYYAHEDDESVPIEDVVGTFGELIAEGRIGAIGLSQFPPHRLDLFARTCSAMDVPLPQAATDAYNLMDREPFESELLPAMVAHGILGLPFFGLARGFLTGKYRDGAPAVDSPRASAAADYLDERGRRVLAALDEVSGHHGAEPATVALAWLRSRPGVGAPIASARNVEQLAPLLASTTLQLDDHDLAVLTAASQL
jgi:aryl-alcohol dehydrogenase-like predicted oxidoreductase